jgi:preprotein translocase subunit YajC
LTAFFAGGKVQSIEEQGMTQMTSQSRRDETSKLQNGQRITYSGFPGTVTKLYDDGPREGARMYEIRLASGTACVCGSDLIPV